MKFFIPKWVMRLGAIGIACYISANFVIAGAEAKTHFIEHMWAYDQSKIANMHDPGPIKPDPAFPPHVHLRQPVKP